MTSRSTELRAIAKTLLFIAAFLLAAAAHVAAQTTTVVLVRHAEKVDASADPLLSDAGQARARALVDALKAHDISAIITTQFKRTQLTAAPLAAHHKLTPVVIDAQTPPAEYARRIREHAGRTVLVVGHSNTVPALITALGGPDIGQIPDPEYDNVFVLRIEADGSVKLERRKY
jgi:broad specificity phosphatase PhoE